MKVLFTKRPDDETQQILNETGWQIDIVETLTIITEPVNELPEADYLVISSRNASHALQFVSRDHYKKVFCIGPKLHDLLRARFSEENIITANSMNELSQSILKEAAGSMVFLCGDHHRDELEKNLHGTGFKLNKIICYRSIQLFPEARTDYDTVFLFSPRSAESLFKKNQFPANTLFACIGKTTADEARSCGYYNIYVASHPSITALINEVAFKSEKNNAK